eukprot:scpid56633/ scgid28958/ 
MAGVPDVSHLPSLPPGYEDAIERCNVVGGVQNLPQRDNMTTGGQSSSAVLTVDGDELTRGQNVASTVKAPSLIITPETEEHRAAAVLHESRWLMEEALSIDDAESLLRACGSDGSFVITGTSSPNMYALYCRRVTGDGAVDSVENMSIEKTESGSFQWRGQGEFLTLSECAARFLHLNPHKHCPMFANRRVWSNFSSMFTGDVETGFELMSDRSEQQQLESGTALHNTIHQNDWFFPALSEEQAAYMLNQHGRSNCFVVSNRKQSENYILSTRQAIPGVEQDIIEHLKVTKIMDGIFQMAGDDNFHQHLDAVVKSYRESNPTMLPLFARSHSRASDLQSLSAASLCPDGDDEQMVVPPEYNEASVMPNPDELTRLPTVAALTVPDGDVDATTTTGASSEGNSTAGNTNGSSAPRTGSGRSTEKCCVIL